MSVYRVACPVAVHLSSGALLQGQVSLPFSPGRHVDTDRIGEESALWLRRLGLLGDHNAATFARARFFDLAGRVHHGDSRFACRLAADFIAALFVLDDWMDATADRASRHRGLAAARVEHLREAAHSGRAAAPRDAGEGVAAALADLRQRLDAVGAPVEGWLGALDQYLNGLVEEAGRRVEGFVSVEDYAELRAQVSAVDACLALALAAEGEMLPAGAAAAARQTNLCVSYVNDLFSWPKEQPLGERSNLVAVLRETAGLDPGDAFTEACRISDATVAAYFAAAPTGRARRMMEGWMRGNYDWHALGTERYTAGLSVAPVGAEDHAPKVPNTHATPAAAWSRSVHDTAACP